MTMDLVTASLAALGCLVLFVWAMQRIAQRPSVVGGAESSGGADRLRTARCVTDAGSRHRIPSARPRLLAPHGRNSPLRKRLWRR